MGLLRVLSKVLQVLQCRLRSTSPGSADSLPGLLPRFPPQRSPHSSALKTQPTQVNSARLQPCKTSTLQVHSNALKDQVENDKVEHDDAEEEEKDEDIDNVNV